MGCCDQGTARQPPHKAVLTVALAGNPNCGKSALFNAFTGIRQKTGNWPGVTVDRKEGRFQLDGRPVAEGHRAWRLVLCALLSAIVMTAWDLTNDPLMAHA